MSAINSNHSLPGLFLSRARERGCAPFCCQRQGRRRIEYTWQQAEEKVIRLAASLLRHGFAVGDRAAIMADNGPAFVFCDLAVQAAGGVVVPIYTTCSIDEITHIVSESECSLFFWGKGHPPEKIKAARPDLFAETTWVRLNDESGGIPLSDWLKHPASPVDRAAVEKRVAEVQRDHLSSIIYTSGTTGPSKGVMLTHGNILANLDAALETITMTQEDVLLSFLPMSHSFERTVGYYAAIAVGLYIHFARSMGTVVQDFEEAAPTLAMTVPRFLEKMRQRILEGVKNAGLSRRWLAEFTLRLRRSQVEKRLADKPIGMLQEKLGQLLSRLVLGKIRKKLGGRLRYLVSGGAALSLDLWIFFESVGIPVVQGYGLTENAPVISCNPPVHNRPASVGLPIRNVAVRLAEDGEIEVSGPAVMKGYWKDPQATEQAMTRDGWLKTGDVGHLDGEGYLHITDRKKDILVTAAGKNISPQNIENALSLNDLVEFACVLGEGKNQLGALISPNLESLALRAKERFGLDDTDPLRDDQIHILYQEAIHGVNRGLASHEWIRRFCVVKEPFTRESGILTPTLKVRRKQVQKKYAKEIQELFG